MATKLVVNVFVYGTLKRGQPNHFWMTNSSAGDPANYVGAGRMTCEYPLVIGTRYNVPFLLDSPGKGKLVCGEVYSVDEDKLAHIDVLEEYPQFYTRQKHEIELIESNERKECWVYMLQNFPSSMLSKPMLSNYENSVELPYKERSQRLNAIPAKTDLEFDSNKSNN